ncbi:MAG: hypothetical protein ABSH00_07985, partial [Bryobacteraceae bacterium]
QANNLQQLPAIFIRNHKRGGRSAGHRSLSMGQSQAKVKLFMIHYTSRPIVPAAETVFRRH